MFLSVSLFFVLGLGAQAANWVSLPINAPPLVDGAYFYHQVDVLVGSPPQTEPLAINLASTLLAVSSADCPFCPGNNLFQPALSSSFNSSNEQWPNGAQSLNGILAQDQLSFGGLINDASTAFTLIEFMARNFSQRLNNGNLGLFVSIQNETTRNNHILTQVQSQLLNPVLGIKLGGSDPRMTVGALNPDDYEGDINWVSAELSEPTWDTIAAIKIDGFEGGDGKLLNFASPLLTGIDSLSKEIYLPNATTYWQSVTLAGNAPVELDTTGSYSIPCSGTNLPNVTLGVVINGVKYPMINDMLRPPSAFAPVGNCNTAIRDITNPGTIGTVTPTAVLGVTFLRNVYLAYRFPTADCPQAFYGFAFPSKTNGTIPASVISQTPTSTPSGASQCLALVQPSTTPQATINPEPPVVGAKSNGDAMYSVFGQPDAAQVTLRGVDNLPRATAKPTSGVS